MYTYLKASLAILSILLALNFNSIYCVKKCDYIQERNNFIQIHDPAEIIVKKEDRYDSYIEKIYNDSLQREEFTRFAHDLLQDRIDYWKKILKNAQETKETDVLDEIPLYIKLNQKIYPENMLGFCDIDRNEFFGESGNTYFDEKCNLPVVIIFRNCIKNMVYFLFVLHHELTHIEQWMNAYCIKNVLKTNLIPETNLIDINISNDTFYTNKEANDIYSYYEKHKSISESLFIADNIKAESEADKNAINFFTNPFLLSKTFITQNNYWSFSKNLTQEGYLSKDDMQYYINKTVSSFYKNRMQTLLYHSIKSKKWKKDFPNIQDYFRNRLKKRKNN